MRVRLADASGGDQAPPVRRVEIVLSAMRFHVRVGVLPHEREHPQPLEVDLAARCVADPPGVVDYRELYQLVHDVVCPESLELLEEIADAIAARVLLVHKVESVRVAVRKPNVVLAGPLAYAEISVERSHV